MPTSATHIAGAGSFPILNGGGATLRRINVNAAATTVTVYDGVSASSPARVIAVIGTATGPNEYGIPLTQGLFIVVSGSGADVTVVVDTGSGSSLQSSS